MPYSITREDPVRDSRALRSIVASLEAVGCSTSAAVQLAEIADSIEEQVPKIDPVEALVQEFTFEADSDAAEFWTTVQWRKHHDAFAAAISEVVHVDAGGGYNPILQQVRDLLFRSPCGSLTHEEIGTAYKALRKGLSGILSDSPQSDDGAAAPPADVQGVAAPSAAERATATAAPSSVTEDPREFGSVVRASTDGINRVLWCRAASGYWFSEESRRATFNEFSAVEVLRVGIATGLDRARSWRLGYNQATKHTRERLYNRITALKPQLITSVEKTVIDKALAEIEKDVEDTITGRGYPS